jgi:hypothetical protein
MVTAQTAARRSWWRAHEYVCIRTCRHRCDRVLLFLRLDAGQNSPHDRSASRLASNTRVRKGRAPFAFKQWGNTFPGAACVVALVDPFAQHRHRIETIGESGPGATSTASIQIAHH